MSSLAVGTTDPRSASAHNGSNWWTCCFGCLYAGAIAVPAYPPRLNRNLHRLQAVVGESQATLALSVLNSLRWLATDNFNDLPTTSGAVLC